MHLKKQSQKDEEKQIQYGLIKVVDFEIILLKIFSKKTTFKCIQHAMKKNLLLLRDLLEL